MADIPKWLDEPIDAAEEVLKHLGGMQYTEGIYEEALCHELRIRGVPYERQRNFELLYKGYTVGSGRCDFILNPFWAAKEANEYVLELKAVKEISKAHKRQAEVYMISLNIPNGAVLSFHHELGVLVEPLEKPDIEPVDRKVCKAKRKKAASIEKLIRSAVNDVHGYFGTEFIYRESTNKAMYEKAIGLEFRLNGVATTTQSFPIQYKCQQISSFDLPFIFPDGSAMVLEFYKKPEYIDECKEYYDYHKKQFGIEKIYIALVPQKEDLKIEFVKV